MLDRIIAGRYRLVREVGHGGMATVYLAVDEKHHREVALKVLRPDLAVVVGSARFLREIEITAALNHPHILPLLDSGAEDGVLYYVMPYVAGGSLRPLLSQALPLEAVTRIVQEVASALDHAHARNVIHRDIKPENILFNEGLAVVSDFGIARVVSGAGEAPVAGGPRMTGTGLSVGTLGYMSPEQALGAGDLDPRTDVYSLACVAYEMLVGETPSSWPGVEDVRLGRFSDLSAAHRARLDGYPGRVEQVLVKGLALRPQHRFETTGELASALAAAGQPTARFSDEQVRRLLERAAALEAEAPASEPDGSQLTMGAVEQVAAQVGIPPSHVREAAKELERSEPGPASPVAGLPATTSRPDVQPPAPRTRPGGALSGDWRRLRGDRWNQLVAVETVDGEVPESAFAGMVGEIQRRLGIAGHASIVAGTLTWSPAAPGENTRKLVIQVTSVDGGTEIRIQEDLEIHGAQRAALPVGGLVGLAFFAAIGHVLGVADPAIGLFIVAGAGSGVLAAIRAVVGFDASDRAPELEELARSLADMGRAALAGPAAATGEDES